MKLCFISDTHLQHKGLTSYILSKDIDYLFHCGDMTNFGTVAELESVNTWFAELKLNTKIKDIICIAGNHDQGLEKYNTLGSKVFTNAVYLENSGYYLDNGLYVWGSPITLRFGSWGFQKEKSEIQKYWNMIPENTNILITHQPCFEILDQNYHFDHCGCDLLRDTVFTLQDLIIHSFGHIHESYGIKEINNKKFINASSINRNGYYNEPIVIEI